MAQSTASSPLRRGFSPDLFGAILFWSLLALTLLTTLLLPSAVGDQRVAWWFEHAQASAYIGNVLLLVLAARQASGRQQLAALVLVVGLLLMLVTIVEHIAGYQPDDVMPSTPLLLYIVIYGCSTFGLTLLFPIERWRRGDLLRILSDVLLMMSVADVLLQIVLTRHAPVGITPQISASAFRLVTSIGLALWCALIYWRYGEWRGLALRLFGFGLLGMLCTDALLLAGTVLAEGGASPMLLRVVVPAAIFHQTCWTTGLWVSRQQGFVWRAEPQWSPQRTGPLATILALRQIVLVSAPLAAFILSPSLRAAAWLIAWLLLREWFWGRTFGRTVQQLDATQTEVRQASMRLELFVRSIAHDLRSQAQYFRYQLGPSGNDADHALLKQQADHVEQLIAGLDNFVEARELHIEFAPVDLVAVADDAIVAIYPEALERDVNVRLNALPSLPFARADGVAIRRILDNLLRNALRATKANDSIVVSIQHSPDPVSSLILGVSDTGHGIGRDLLPRIFEPKVHGFLQGSGLGLTIVRMLVDALGGTINVVTSEGHGTTFIIRLPIWQHDAERPSHDNDTGD